MTFEKKSYFSVSTGFDLSSRVLFISTMSPENYIAIVSAAAGEADSQKIQISTYQWSSLGDQSQTTLGAIEGLLLDRQLALNDITAIIVQVGKGSYTGIRSGVSIANTLGYVCKKPVFCAEQDEQKIDQVAAVTFFIQKFQKRLHETYDLNTHVVQAKYAYPVRITPKRT